MSTKDDKKTAKIVKKNILKTCFRFFIFLSLIFLIGCSITKRRYTHGYYVNWDNKTPNALVGSQIQTTRTQARQTIRYQKKIESLSSPSEKEKVTNQKVFQVINITKSPTPNYFRTGKIEINSFPVTFIQNQNFPSDTIHNTNEKKDSKIYANEAWPLCLLGIVTGVIFGFIALIASSFAAGLLLLLPLALFIASLIYCYKAIRVGRKWGLIPIIVLDIASVIILFISIWGIVFFPLI